MIFPYDENIDRSGIWNIATIYDHYLCDIVDCKSIEHEGGGDSPQQRKEHARWMCWQIHRFIDEGKIERANRWVGFIQGILFSLEIFTLEELKAHNR